MPQHHSALRRLASRLVLAGTAAILVACSGTSGDQRVPVEATDDLPRLLADAPSRFALTYRSRGTEVLDCVFPNREFDATVFDPDTFTVTATATDTPIALRTGGTTYLAGSLFGGDEIGADWLAIGREERARLAEPIQRALGTDLSAYVLADAAPASGTDIALDGLSMDPDTTTIDPIEGSRGSASGHRLVIGGVNEEPGVVLDFWVDPSGQVARVQVQQSLQGEPRTPNPDTGWVVDYTQVPDWLPRPSAPTNTIDSATVDPGILQPPIQEGCDLEIGPEPTAPIRPRA